VVRITARLNVGGIARHVTWLSAGLRPFGYDTLLVTGTVPAGEEDMSDFTRAEGVEPLYIPEMSREISPKDLVTLWKLYRLFCRVRPAIIHTHSAKAGTVGRLAGWMYRWFTWGTLIGRPRRCRVVHTFHGHIFHSYYGRLKTRLFLTIEKFLARFATHRIVVISPQQLQEICLTYGVGRADQFRIVRLGLDLEPFVKYELRRPLLRAELCADADEILVGIVGRLTEIKNHEMFLQVAAQWRAAYQARHPRVRFVIVGNGHLRQQLEQRAAQLGLGDALVFLGNRTDPDVFFAGLDIVALTSLNEGTPLTLIEAMANARPLISTAVGGVVDLLGAAQDGMPGGAGWKTCEHGVSVESGQVEGFCEGLASLVRDAGARTQLGERGRAFVQERYSRERLLRDAAELYGELLD
jgi:glycosyltransferase involved in cell wall biosynthesis